MDLSKLLFPFRLELHPIAFFAAAGVFFILAVLEPLNHRRSVFTALHLAAYLCILTAHPAALQSWPALLVPFTIGLAFHTTSTLLVHRKSIDRRAGALPHRLRLAVVAWINITRQPPPATPNVDREKGSGRRHNPWRTRDAAQRVGRCFWLCLGNLVIATLADRVVMSLGVTMFDFRPEMQSLIPSFRTMTVKSISLRALFSVYWVWNTYFSLQVGHDMVAAMFIHVFQLSQPDEWPGLFGKLSEAYSLRRFWGVFWHRLHVVPFLSFMPSMPSRYQTFGKMLKPLWIFALSALCHAVANWSQTRRTSLKQECIFFLCNWFVCTMEVILSRLHFVKALTGPVAGGYHTDIAASPCLRWWRRAVGFLWVWLFFMSTVPGWQYPSIYQSVTNGDDI